MRLTDYRLTSAGAVGSPDLASTNKHEPSAIPTSQMDEEIEQSDYVRWTEQDLDPALIDPIEPREFEWNEQRKGF